MNISETAELSLAEQLERGPGSRELGDRMLLAMGWQTEQHGQDRRSQVWRHDQYSDWLTTRPDPSRVTDDALALAAAPGLEDVEPAMIVWEEDEGGEHIRVVLNNGYENFTGKAYGDNALPRAICLAAWRAKEVGR